MWKVYQDKTVANDGYGNCKSACIASILELRLIDVPDIKTTDPDYHKRWEEALAYLGYKVVSYPIFDGEDDEWTEIPKGYSIASVDTTRVFPEGHPKAGQNIKHAVVAFNGKVVHDPFPEGSEITKIHYYDVLVPISASERNEHNFGPVIRDCVSADSRVSMTWPQYLRRQCKFNGKIIRLTKIEVEIVMVLLMQRPRPVLNHEMVEAVYKLEDSEPDYALGVINTFVRRINRKFGITLIKYKRLIGYQFVYDS